MKSMLQSGYPNEQVSTLNSEGIQQIRSGDYDGALTSFHRAFLLSTNHSTFKSCNVGEQRIDESVSSSCNIVNGSGDGSYRSLPEKASSGREYDVDHYCDVERKDTKSLAVNDGRWCISGHRSFDHQIELDEGMCHFKEPLHIPSGELLDEEVVQATLLYNIAILYSKTKEEEEAELHFIKVLSIITDRSSIDEIYGDCCISNTTSFQGPTFLPVLHNIGHMQFRSSKYEDAVRTYRKALRNTALFCRSELVSNSDKYFNLDVSNALNCLGVALSYMAIGQRTLKQREVCLEKASDALTQALAIRETILGHRHNLETATIINNLGRVKFLADCLNQAEILYEEAYHIRIVFLEEMHIDIAAVLHNMGQVHYEFGNLQKSINHYHNCLDILLSIKIGKGNPKVVHLLLEIGDIYMEIQRFDLAMEYYSQALSQWCSRINDTREESQKQCWCSGTASLIQKKLDKSKSKRNHNLLHKHSVNSTQKTPSLAQSSYKLIDSCGLV